MNFSFDRPYAFFGLLFVIPAFAYTMYRCHRLVVDLGGFYNARPAEADCALQKFRHKILIRSICSAAAWVMLVCAYAGFSWGAASVPVQKGGHAVSFVFDISWSMNAPDAPGGLTRLDASARYADMLLDHMGEESVSVILVKGDGIIAVPLTEDKETVRLLLRNLSPAMMSAAGSSLGKGIRVAVRSFPQNLSQFEYIWVFTDGDETDGQLSGALADAAKYGIPVTLIGFGAENETEILAGDGKTKVKTALRASSMKKTAAAAARTAGIQLHIGKIPPVQYIDATEAGSAIRILQPLTGDSMQSGRQEAGLAYETRKVRHQGIFIGLSLLLFVTGFLFSEFNFAAVYGRIAGRKKAAKTIHAAILCAVSVFFTACSVNMQDSKRILQSTWAWQQKNYRSAVAGFLQTEENAAARGDRTIQQYALYGLAATYMMQGEDEAALKHFDAVALNAPGQIRFSAYYNAGIIADRSGNYQKAAYYFRQALLQDSKSIDAKINLELSMKQQETKQTQSEQQESQSIPENTDTASSMEKAVFSRIQENEQKQWKNQQSDQKSSSGIDY